MPRPSFEREGIEAEIDRVRSLGDSMPNASERKQILTNLDQVQQVPKPPAPEPGHEPGNIPPPPPSEIPVPDPAPPPIENPGDVPLPPITDPDVTDSLPSPSCRPASSQQLWMATGRRGERVGNI